MHNPADPRTLQNDGDPIREAALPKDAHPTSALGGAAGDEAALKLFGRRCNVPMGEHHGEYRTHRIVGWIVPLEVAGLSDALFNLETIERLARRACTPTEPVARCGVATDAMIQAFADRWWEDEADDMLNEGINRREVKESIEAALAAEQMTCVKPVSNFLAGHRCVPRDGEPFFVLLGRDKQAPAAVEKWADDREAAEPGDEKVAGARARAAEMRAYSGAAVPQPDVAPERLGVSDADLAATLVLDLSKARATIGALQKALSTAQRDGWIEGRDAAAEVADVKFGAPPPQVAGARKAIACAIRALSPPSAVPPAPVPAGEVAELAKEIIDLWNNHFIDCKTAHGDSRMRLLRAALTAAQPRTDADEVTEALPEEPTREMWATMADACVKAHCDFNRSMSLAPDFITRPIYTALRAALAARGGKP